MATLEPFATVDQLETFWRPLENDEKLRAKTLLAMASNYLRQIAKNNSVDLDAEKEADTSGIYGDSLQLVTLESVKRAMTTPADAPPADSYSQTASPYSATMTFTDPSSDLFFKQKELVLLGLPSISGNSQFGILRGAR